MNVNTRNYFKESANQKEIEESSINDALYLLAIKKYEEHQSKMNSKNTFVFKEK